MSKKERIQKVLAAAGCGSRRQLEAMIADGLISVNGQVAEIGQAISIDDKVKINGKPVNLKNLQQADKRVLIYHKPEGEVCTRNDPEGRDTVFQQLPKLKQGRWVMIGRLDLNTSGLLLFTTDGEYANQMMHPSSEMEREYLVRVLGEVSAEHLKQLQQGLELEDGMAKFDSIHPLKKQGREKANQWYKVVLTEGRNRIVRRLFEACELQVSRLKRIRYGEYSLPRNLGQGKFLEL